ncbi:MAG: Tetratricopeptide repeat protein [Syntrophorhabdus sp. PtaU1.Bin058]|nr:MAG: Tetratricopeptide repeat protein [Syntrophorhabdus sp. PtaU1.Bin058]
MSLLADLLSKVKHQDQQSSVPPDLARIIQKSAQKKKVERKFIILLVFMLLFVIIGFGAVYFFESYLTSPSGGIAARQNPAPRETQRNIPPAPSPPPVTQGASIAGQTPEVAPPVSQPENQAEPKVAPKIEAKLPPAETQKPKIETTPQPAETKQDRKVAARPRTTQPPKRSSEASENLKAERDTLLYSARSNEYNKNYSQAITDYKKALEKDPRNYLIMNSLASTLIKTGSFEESIRYSRNALDYQKNYIPALINLGIAYIQSGNMTEGETYLTRARTIDPTNKVVLLNLALLYERLPNYQESLAHFQKLLEMKDIRGYLGMARVLEKQGKRLEAERVYRNILSMDDVDPQTKQFANERILAIGNR